MGRPAVMPEIGVARPRRDDQHVVEKRAGADSDKPPLSVHARDLTEQNPNIGLASKEAADRPGDLGGDRPAAATW